MRLSEVYKAYKEGREGLPLSETARATEFASFLARGLRTDLMTQYTNWLAPVNSMFDTKPSDGAFETYPKLSAIDGMGERLAGGEFPRMAFNSEDVRLVNKEYGGICEIDQFLIDTDQTNKLRGLAGTAGDIAGRAKGDAASTYYLAMSAATNYDAVFITALTGAAHPYVTGGAAVGTQFNMAAAGALTEATWEATLIIIQAWRGIFGERINVTPKTIIVGTTDQFSAARLFKDQIRVPTLATTFGHEKNIHFGEVEVVFDKTFGAHWFVKTDVTGLIHQQLTPLEVAQEPNNSGLSFDTRIWRFRLYEAYVLGCVDWRSIHQGN